MSLGLNYSKIKCLRTGGSLGFAIILAHFLVPVKHLFCGQNLAEKGALHLIPGMLALGTGIQPLRREGGRGQETSVGLSVSKLSLRSDAVHL